MLLKHLVLSKNRPVPVNNLIGMFWSEGDKSHNPENALKTMVSRLRASLAKAGPELKNCILSQGRSYAWNPETNCTVDVFEFEELCAELAQSGGLDDATREKYMRVLDVYVGDLFDPVAEEEWIVSRSMYLHHLYLQTMYRFIEALKAEQEHNTIVYVCRIALDIDPFDERLNLELMAALKTEGQDGSALTQYRHMSAMYSKYLGMEPSEKMLGVYKGLIKSEAAAQADILTIRKSLTDGSEGSSGALVCDYSIFKDIYQLQMRNIERQESKMFICLLSIRSPLGEPLEPMNLEEAMKTLLEILTTCLRKGDTVSRYSPSQYAILLAMMSHSGGQVVISRIRSLFYKRYADNTIKLSFQFDGIDKAQ
jgi:DNA-binding SARP family transcriptional activator